MNTSFLFKKNAYYHNTYKIFASGAKKNGKRIGFDSGYNPKTPNQILYNNMLCDEKNKLLFVLGPAGTGKTLLACNHGIRELKKGKYEKIVITRPVVPVEEDIGFLPGNINKKMDPWMRPILDIFLEFFSQQEVDLMMKNNVIEISPLTYMRGRTFKNAYIIADEMQNSSPNQMMMLITRIGTGSKMIVTGDLLQTDRKDGNGMKDFMNKYKKHIHLMNEIKSDYDKNETIIEFLNNSTQHHFNQNNIDIVNICELNDKDIERSEVVKTILDIYKVEEKEKIYKLHKPKLNIQIGKFTITDLDAALIPKSRIPKNKF
jgi:phosphate starvation-inducible PhoH-like protein